MTIHAPTLKRTPDADEAQEALSVLRSWAKGATDAEISSLDPAIAH